MRTVSFKSILILLLMITVSCGKTKHKEDTVPAAGNSYARRFIIETGTGYRKLVLIDPWQGAEGIRHEFYVLGKNEPLPSDISQSDVIRTPVSSLVCMSTTWLSMLKSIGADPAIKGISGKDLVYDTELKEKVESGLIADVGFEDNINKELIVTISPELILTYGVGGESAAYVNKIREMGFRVLFLGDYLEEHPLARIEWIKVLGLLTGRENEADSLFAYTERRYLEIRDSVSILAQERPSVLLGLPWKDTWFISPGNSFVSRLIEDAGGEYIWNETESDISLPYGIENVFIQARKADYWLNTGSASTRREITATDQRLSELPAFISGNLYNNNRRISLSGANDYWESGAVLPHIVLKDIASILHPGLFKDYKPFFYRRVE